MEKRLIIPLALVQAIINYLQKRRFIEVVELISALASLPVYEETKPPEKEVSG
jgi:allophanate hydrolase subunit 1